MKPQKFLLVLDGPLEDIILSTPLIRALKTRWQETEVDYVTHPDFVPVLTENPYINRVVSRREVAWLKQQSYDRMIDLQNDGDSWLLTWQLKIPCYRYKSRKLKTWLKRLWRKDTVQTHQAEQYLQVVPDLNLERDRLGLDFFIPQSQIINLKDLPEGHQKEYVVFAINARYATRKLPVKRMIELCDKINKPIILLGEEEDKENGERLTRFFDRDGGYQDYEPGLAELNKKTVIFNGCGRFNIHQQASLIKQSRAVFCYDHFQMHIAAACGKETFCIWGNTAPRFGYYPYQTKFTVLENNKLNCRPCSTTGFSRCPKGHFKCMEEMVFDFYLY